MSPLGEGIILSFVVLLLNPTWPSKLEAAVEKASRHVVQYERQMKDLEASRAKTFFDVALTKQLVVVSTFRKSE